jgi:hypothetical protein
MKGVDAATLGGGPGGCVHGLADHRPAKEILAGPGRRVPDPAIILGTNGDELQGLRDNGSAVRDWIGHQQTLRKADHLLVGDGGAGRAGERHDIYLFEPGLFAPSSEVAACEIEGVAELDQHVERHE